MPEEDPMQQQLTEDLIAEISARAAGDTAKALGEMLAKVLAGPSMVVVAPSDGINPYTVTVGTDATRIAPYQIDRLRVTLTNRGTGNVWIGGHNDDLPNRTYRIAAAESLTIDTRGELWAEAEVAGQTLEVLPEFKR